MKSIGSMIALLIVGTFANTTWCRAQNPAVRSNQVVTSKPPVLIEVEVQMIELSQEALNQLGADWMINSKTETTNSRTSAIKSIQTGNNSVASNFPGLLSGTSVLADSEVARIKKSLEQHGGCNLLSAPRVTTRSGESAEIKVVQELIYPAAFNVQPVVFDKESGKINLLSTNESVSTATSNRVMVAVSIPKFASRETGVILNVTPTAASDNKTIYLLLKPQIVELVEWIDYGYSMRATDGSPQQVKMLQPVFRSRNLSSHIALWDGQTAVMGGLITETLSDEKASWFSRWFGRKPERKTIRTSLLILVTARRVNIAGEPIPQSQP